LALARLKDIGAEATLTGSVAERERELRELLDNTAAHEGLEIEAQVESGRTLFGKGYAIADRE
jgi:hypothetical protein